MKEVEYMLTREEEKAKKEQYKNELKDTTLAQKRQLYDVIQEHRKNLDSQYDEAKLAKNLSKVRYLSKQYTIVRLYEEVLEKDLVADLDHTLVGKNNHNGNCIKY